MHASRFASGNRVEGAAPSRRMQWNWGALRVPRPRISERAGRSSRARSGGDGMARLKLESAPLLLNRAEEDGRLGGGLKILHGAAEILFLFARPVSAVQFEEDGGIGERQSCFEYENAKQLRALIQFRDDLLMREGLRFAASEQFSQVLPIFGDSRNELQLGIDVNIGADVAAAIDALE